MSESDSDLPIACANMFGMLGCEAAAKRGEPFSDTAALRGTTRLAPQAAKKGNRASTAPIKMRFLCKR